MLDAQTCEYAENNHRILYSIINPPLLVIIQKVGDFNINSSD